MLTSSISNTYGVTVLVSPVILWTHYVLILVLAGVIANDLGNLVLLADAIAMLPLGLQLMFLFWLVL